MFGEISKLVAYKGRIIKPKYFLYNGTKNFLPTGWTCVSNHYQPYNNNNTLTNLRM